MGDRVAARAADLDESSLKKIQAWPLGGSLGEDRVTKGLRRLLAARLVSRAVAADNRVRLQEWVAVGCPGNFWSDGPEVDGAWRRSLGQPDLRTGTSPRTPEQTARRLRELAMELARSGVRGNPGTDAIGVELMKLEATADPFLRPAIFRYRQAMTLGEENEEGNREREAALRDADQAVERWRRWRVQADKLLDWYELNDPDLRLGPALRQWEENLPMPKKEGRPTGFEPATARTTIWSSTNLTTAAIDEPRQDTRPVGGRQARRHPGDRHHRDDRGGEEHPGENPRGEGVESDRCRRDCAPALSAGRGGLPETG